MRKKIFAVILMFSIAITSMLPNYIVKAESSIIETGQEFSKTQYLGDEYVITNPRLELYNGQTIFYADIENLTDRYLESIAISILFYNSKGEHVQTLPGVVSRLYVGEKLTRAINAGITEDWRNEDISSYRIEIKSTGQTSRTEKEEITIEDDVMYYDNHKYQYFEGGISWYDAKERCEEKGGHLLVISSRNEQEYINEYVTSLQEKGYLTKQNIWLGATIENNVIDWVVDEGREFTNWAQGEPNNVYNMQDCVMMYTALSVNGELGYWNDENGNGRNWTGFTLKDTGYICEWDEDVDSEGTDGFCTQNDGWSFVNNEIGFDYSENYRIPKERYEKVFGSRYVAVATTNDKTYNSMMPEWKGNCYGMSATAILFYLDKLDWTKYDDLYENDFSEVNDYFYTLRYWNGIGAYACSDYKTEITELIEYYQAFNIGSDNFGYAAEAGSTINNIDEFWISKDESIYEHNINGTYIATVYDRILNTKEPLLVGIQGEQGGHAMVIRTDKAPTYDGDGWYRVYVYDPNKPYISEEIVENRELAEFYINNNEEDVYIELNIEENKWRYYGATSAGLSEKYWGCDEFGNVKKYINNTRPEFMYVFSISDNNFPTEFRGCDGEIHWEVRNKDSVEIAMTDKSNFVLYSTDGKKLLEVRSGSPIMLAKEIDYFPYVDGKAYSGGGKLVLPYTEFKIGYMDGDDISIIGNDSVVNIACDGALDILICMEDNQIDILSKEKNEITTQITDLGSESIYTSIVVDGVIDLNNRLELSLVENSCLVVGEVTNGSILELYSDNEAQGEETLLMTFLEGDIDVEIPNVRNAIEILDKDAPIISGISDGKTYYGNVTFDVEDAYLDKVYVDDNIINLNGNKYTIVADNKKHIIKAVDKAGNEVTYIIMVNLKDVSYTVNGYNGVYDGQLHSITINIEETNDIKVTYSTDGKIFSEIKPQFTDKGEYRVYYHIEGKGYNTIDDEERVIIQGKGIIFIAKDQNIKCGSAIDKTMYTVNGLVEGDRIIEYTLVSNKTEDTKEGVIEVKDVKIVNTDDKDVTDNYDIVYKSGKLQIEDEIETPNTGDERIMYIWFVILGIGLLCLRLAKSKTK